MNFKLTIQYDGTDFHGWQMQEELRTVQGELTDALSLIKAATLWFTAQVEPIPAFMLRVKWRA